MKSHAVEMDQKLFCMSPAPGRGDRYDNILCPGRAAFHTRINTKLLSTIVITVASHAKTNFEKYGFIGHPRFSKRYAFRLRGYTPSIARDSERPPHARKIGFVALQVGRSNNPMPQRTPNKLSCAPPPSTDNSLLRESRNSENEVSKCVCIYTTSATPCPIQQLTPNSMSSDPAPREVNGGRWGGSSWSFGIIWRL